VFLSRGGLHRQPVFAVQFEVKADGAAPANSVLEPISQRTVRWVEEWYSARMSMDVDLQVRGGGTNPAPSHTIMIDRKDAEGGEQTWRLLWTYPDGKDESLLWQSQALLAISGNHAEFTFILRLTSRQFEIRRAGIKVRPPRIVREIVDAFPCYLGDLRLSTKPRTLGADDIHNFVRVSLRAEDRRLPVVAVSGDRVTGLPLLDPSLLASRSMASRPIHVHCHCARPSTSAGSPVRSDD